MCGIVGVVESNARADAALVSAMRDRLAHRGPDDAGTWCNENVGLGHRRLSIIDLSVEGHQPMVSADGRFVIVYNGEIYNFAELRAQLPERVWRGHSDTEILLEAIAAWGIDTTLRRCVGIFALAVFDRERRELTLARDQLGIKPLYYGWCGRRFVFASELAAFDSLPSAHRLVSRDSLSMFLRYSQVPAPHTIYEGIYKLPPGTWLCIATHDAPPGTPAEPVTYWSAADAFAQPAAAGDANALEEETLRLLRQSVSSQLVADVPVGAFLSGGIDSSLVVALMQECSSRPVKTFTIGFERAAYDEAPAARKVAAHLGTDHTELIMGERDLLDTVTALPGLCDEPFGDSSILPTHLVSRLARRDVTVSLSGDGGDELFWGYTRYPLCDALWARLQKIPAGLRSFGGAALRSRPVQAVGTALPSLGLPGRPGRLGDKLRRIADVFGYTAQSDVYLDFMSHWKTPDRAVIGAHERASVYSDPAHWTTQLPMWRRMAVQDLLAYLPNDILTKVDRASMRVGLEARVPLLDHRFVEFCLTLPEQAIRGGGEPKRLMKRLLARYVPPALTDRPKQGFGVPMAEWLRGPLKAWASDLLSQQRLSADGYLEARPVCEKLEQHLNGDADWSACLWDALMFQSWLDARKCAASNGA
jgi:asparagine synthase (glutamine-hydrolysing)